MVGMNPDTEKDQSSIIGDLLAHYSSRAVAHASFFIASIFGLVTLSAIIQQLSENVLFLILSMLLFFAFSYVGYFTMSRFGYYADLAERLASYGLHQYDIMEGIKSPSISRALSAKSFQDYFNSQAMRQEQYLLFRKFLVGRRSRAVLGIGYLFGIFLLGLIAYEKFLDKPLVYVPFGILFGLTLLIVALPVVITQHAESEKGYDLGKEVKEDERRHICQEWTELEKQILPLKAKKDSQKTDEENKLKSDYEIFWVHKVLETTKEKGVSNELAKGFRKAILEKCK
jgi:hypothetical protein